MGIMQGLRKKDRGSAHGGAATNAPKPPRKLPEPTTPLMLMLPDAAGIAAYQLNVFSSPKAAEFFIDSSLRGKMSESAVMFWALNWEPKGIAAAEPLVLIRDGKNVVYPFSFSDIESAFEFVRQEVQRGLHLYQVMIYWAVAATAETDFWGRSKIVPTEAPRRHVSVVTTPAVPEVTKDARTIAAGPTDVPQIEASKIEAPQTDDDTERFLQDEDIADAVRQANHIATHTAPEVPETNGSVVPMPAPAPSSRKSKKQPQIFDAALIDFVSASQKVEESRAARAAINAWGNFAQAVDEALDVYVARQVATKLAWNRISRALGQAIEVQRRAHVEAKRTAREAEAPADEARQEAARVDAAEAARLEEERLAAARAEAAEAARVVAAREAAKLRGLVFAWRNGSTALIDCVRIAQHDSMVRRCWAIGTAELASAAQVVAKRKGLRRAWLNAGWTLEEAAYAYALEQKSRAIRAWRSASTGIAAAVAAPIAYETSMRTAWSNAGIAIAQAHRAQTAQLRMLQRSWATGSKEIRIAVLTRQRMIRVRTGLNNFSIALEGAFEARAYREEMIEAWDAAIDGLLSAAGAKEYYDMVTAAWGNVAFALEGVCGAYIGKQKRAIRAWGRLAKGFGSALDAKIQQDAAIAAWTNISFALEDAVFAKRRYLGLVFAWTSASAVIAEAVIARRSDEAAVTAWTNASIALEEATVALARYLYFGIAWEGVGYAMRDAVEAYFARKAGLESAWEALTFAFDDAVQAMIFRDQSIAAWQTATVAFRQAVVTEAKLRIAAAKLDRKQMATVEKLVKAATARGKTADSRESRADDAVEEIESAPEPFVPPLATSYAELPGECLPDDSDNESAEQDDDLTVDLFDDAEEDGPAGSNNTPLFPDLWRSHDPSQWKPRGEPFRGFESPPGRF